MPSILQLEVTSLPLANLSGSRIAIDGPMTISDIPLPPGTVLPSSIPIPVPPYVHHTTTKLMLAGLINRTRKEFIRSRFVDLTDDR
jgi:hypothetical protein